jgi:hypothetical protein
MLHSIDRTLYVNKVPVSGWLNVKLKSGQHVSLLKYTKVQVLETKNGSTWFTILDGAQKGKIVGLSEANAKEYLGRKAPLQHGANVVIKYQKVETLKSIAKRAMLTQQTASLSVDGIQALVTLNTDLGSAYNMYTPIPPGLYKIRVPDYPHDKNMTAFYRERVEPSLKNDQVWFPIVYGNNSRFIHVGNVSEGCVTVMALDKWNAIVEALLSHRIPGTNFIGQIMVSK